MGLYFVKWRFIEVFYEQQSEISHDGVINRVRLLAPDFFQPVMLGFITNKNSAM